MLKRILDTSEIGPNVSLDQNLQIDLRRMDKLDHLGAPTGSDCYRVIVSKGVYSESFVFEQGYSMNKPSEIFAKLKIDGKEIKEVIVGGSAIIEKEMEIEV